MVNTLKRSMSNRIRGAREKKDLTRSEVADSMGVTRQQYSRWEDTGDLKVSTLKKVAVALDVSLFELLPENK